jgi:hypothetical protein
MVKRKKISKNLGKILRNAKNLKTLQQPSLDNSLIVPQSNTMKIEDQSTIFVQNLTISSEKEVQKPKFHFD